MDHIVLVVIGLAGALFGLYLLSEAKAYRARQHTDGKRHNGVKHA